MKMTTHQRGSVKSIERARRKAENDYKNEEYPTTACVLDFNRCSLVFDKISSLLYSLKLFENKIKYYQSGNIIQIVRYKNGFKNYVIDTKTNGCHYADIKLNVLIKGQQNSIIGEVQFLLQKMLDFKKKSHKLYNIARDKEYFSSHVSLILPKLIDNKEQLFVAANLGDINKLLQLITLSNFDENKLMLIDKSTQTSIVMILCALGHYKALQFVIDYVSMDLFMNRLFLDNIYNHNAIEGALYASWNNVLNVIFSIRQVQTIYKKDKRYFYRLIYFLFGFNINVDNIDNIFKLLNVTKEQLIDILNYQYPLQSNLNPSAWRYDTNRGLLYTIVSRAKLNVLKKFVSILGKSTF